MQTILTALREILGEADFYQVVYGNTPTWNYSLMIEYFIGALILLISISFVFKFILKLVK